MKVLNVIIAPQEFEEANHKNFWYELSKNLDGKTVVMNIPSDAVVSNIKKKKYRIQEHKLGLVKKQNNLYVLRPHYFIRPEILPSIFDSIIANRFIKNLEKFYPDFKEHKINIISYDGKWINTLKKIKLNISFYYYILDEVNMFANNASKNEKKEYFDKIACENSKKIFVMSEEIYKVRKKFKEKIILFGNGSSFPNNITEKKIDNSQKNIGFVGNFRDWIDFELLNKIINLNKEYTFSFVGPIQPNVKEEFNNLLNKNVNVLYYGKSKKEDVEKYYNKLDVVIVPYKQNDFMRATRPIKIVEAIFNMVPVVSIPINGYKESEFLRFATNEKEFSEEITYLMNNKIDSNSLNYSNFLLENSWEYKAKIFKENM